MELEGGDEGEVLLTPGSPTVTPAPPWSIRSSVAPSVYKVLHVRLKPAEISSAENPAL